ncbi:MAG: UvrD-helicase domain-containing protein, partial [Deltaproteobacteria bacterium]|nr:UvrD-helicase domain-containing protein [Deltaproteobacteria bacterium]
MKHIELINASAGSGKTYSLTSRVIEELKGDMAPEALMATTFTNKAAAELRERIRLGLLKHERTDQAQHIFDGFLGTINSICARLLKEYALDAGLSPALDVLPEEDGSRLFQIAIARVINDHAETMEPVARRLSMDGGGSGHGKRPDWRDDVKRIVDMARSNNMNSNDLKIFSKSSWESIQDLFGNPRGSGIREDLEHAVNQALHGLKTIKNPKKSTQASLDELKRIKQDMLRGIDIPWMEWVRIAKLGTNKDGEGMLDAINRIAGEVMRHPDFQADVKEMIHGVFQCAGVALQYYEMFKQKQGLMDFVDQETKVLDLARENEAFHASMQDRLQLMMVDEFQDTSPIQLALFMEISALAGRSVWVGDPKQAIYGFRGTDPQLMDQATKLLKNTRTLDKSWRSRETLVKFTNALFSEVFHWMGKDRVMLHIPDERKDKAMGGWIESWNLPVRNNSDEAKAVAVGVQDLLSRREDIRPGDIA